MPKGTSRAEATSNSEKIKPVALAVIELRLSEGISQIPLNKVFCKKKFRSNLLKTFWVDLKACLDLVLPNNTASSSSGKIEAGFLVMLFCGYYTVLSHCTMNCFTSDKFV